MHSKDELHQWDELKQNQRPHLEDLLDQHWSSRGDTFPPGEGFSLPGEEPSQSGEAVRHSPHWAHNSTRLHGTKEQTGNPERKDGNKTVFSDNELVEGGDGLLPNSSEGRVTEEDRGKDEGTQTHSLEDNSEFSVGDTWDVSQPVTQSPQAKFSPAQETVSERAGSRFRPTKEPNPDPRNQARRRHNETPEEERILQIEETKLEEERKELLLLHKRLDEEKELLRQQQMKRDEDERQKEKETDRRHQLHGKHHQLQQTTTQRPGLDQYRHKN